MASPVANVTANHKKMNNGRQLQYLRWFMEFHDEQIAAALFLK